MEAVADIFVSYASEDRERVKSLVSELESTGWTVWWDRRIGIGSSFDREIERELAAAACVIVVWSRSAVESDWVREEASEARIRKILVPLQIDDCQPPLGFRRSQTADLTGWPATRGQLDDLLESVRTLVSPSAVRLPDDKRDTAPARVVAVLPFVNIGDTDDYFSDGIAEEILSRMIRVDGIRVISRQSSFRFKGSLLDVRVVGKELGAHYILGGTVRRVANEARINVRLTDVADGTEVWGASFEADLADILKVQQEIAIGAINGFLPDIVMEPMHRVVDRTAYELYLRAARARAANDLSAMPLLQSAVAIDKDFGEAYGALAGVYLGALLRGYPAEAREIQKLAKLALELDPGNTDALGVQAVMQLLLEHDLPASLSKLEALIDKTSNIYPYQYYFWALADILEVDKLLWVSQRRRQLAPDSSTHYEVNAHYATGDFEKARIAAERMPVDVYGNDEWSGRTPWLILIDIASKNFENAERNINVLKDRLPTDIVSYFLLWLAIEKGELDDARRRYRSDQIPLTTMPWMHWLPLDVVLTGETSRTLDEIEHPKSVQSMNWIMSLRYREQWLSKYGAPAFREAFNRLHDQARYQAALVHYGIDDDSLAKIRARDNHS
jgi:TolB-like protein